MKIFKTIVTIKSISKKNGGASGSKKSEATLKNKRNFKVFLKKVIKETKN